jgi:hypothetical protein
MTFVLALALFAIFGLVVLALSSKPSRANLIRPTDAELEQMLRSFGGHHMYDIDPQTQAQIRQRVIALAEQQAVEQP